MPGTNTGLSLMAISSNKHYVLRANEWLSIATLKVFERCVLQVHSGQAKSSHPLGSHINPIVARIAWDRVQPECRRSNIEFTSDRYEVIAAEVKKKKHLVSNHPVGSLGLMLYVSQHHVFNESVPIVGRKALSSRVTRCDASAPAARVPS